MFVFLRTESGIVKFTQRLSLKDKHCKEDRSQSSRPPAYRRRSLSVDWYHNICFSLCFQLCHFKQLRLVCESLTSHLDLKDAREAMLALNALNVFPLLISTDIMTPALTVSLLSTLSVCHGWCMSKTHKSDSLPTCFSWELLLRSSTCTLF